MQLHNHYSANSLAGQSSQRLNPHPQTDSATTQSTFAHLLQSIQQPQANMAASSLTANTRVSQAATPDAAQNVTPGAETRNVRGLNVIVSGHGFERSPASGTPLEQIAYTAQVREQQEKEFELRNIGGPELATMIAPDEPLTGFGTITPISFLGYEMHPAEIVLSSDSSDIVNYERQLLSKFMRQMETTKALEQEYGSDIKVGFDPQQQSYVMLRPGDHHYDNLVSSQEAHDYMKATFDDEPKRYQYLGDILSRHGYYMG
ncbi:MAG: hypothetical protein ACPG4U_01525 [Pseudomonadales bacterium]